ncbi:MAG: helix-turn-helix transcriptional regulator [Actinomycetota bacterium]
MSDVAEGRLGRRLRRILVLLPYAIKHPGVTVDELSRKFGVRSKDLMDDLDLVFMCGLPGYGPGDLIDVSVDEDRVYIRMADYFSAPLRLTPAEGLALYAAGAPLAELPEMKDADALRRALVKLGRALGMSGDEQDPGIDVELAGGSVEHMERLQEALAAGRRVHLEYLSATRGELTERDVDPWALIAALGRWYLVALDHLSDEERMFRLDRMKEVTILDADAPVPDDFDPSRYRGAFVGGDEEPVMSMEIAPAVARWFSEYYPIRSNERMSDGWERVEMIASGPVWAAKLLLQLGAGVRNVQPGELDAAARELAGSIAANYS